MLIETATQNFKVRIQAETRSETQRFYLDCLKPVEDYLNDLGYTDLDELKEMDVLKYINSLITDGYSSKTINNRVYIIKRLIKEQDETTKQQDAILKIKKRKKDAGHFMPLSMDQCSKFIEWVYSIPTEKSNRNLKKKCMFLLAVQNGIRANEMVEIRVTDLMLDQNRIRLSHTKTGTPRLAFFDDYTKELLEDYIKRFNPTIFLFESCKTHNKMLMNSYCVLYDKARKECGINVSGHVLRSTLATQALRNKCNIESVRIMMGHSNLKTTQMYLHFLDDEICKDNQEYNPLALYNRSHRLNLVAGEA